MPQTVHAFAELGRLKGTSSCGLRVRGVERSTIPTRGVAVYGAPRRSRAAAPRLALGNCIVGYGDDIRKGPGTEGHDRKPGICGTFLRWDRRDTARSQQLKELEAPVGRLAHLGHRMQRHTVGELVAVVLIRDEGQLRDVAPIADPNPARRLRARAVPAYRKSRWVTYGSTRRAVASVVSGPARWCVVVPSENPVIQAVA